MEQIQAYIVSADEQFTHFLLKYLPFAKDHFKPGLSTTITKLFVLILITIVVYDLIFKFGVKFNLWEDVTKKIFIEKPVHCAHVYAKVNFYKSNKESPITDFYDFDDVKFTLAKPLNYHIEFGPEEYDYEDEELGTTVGFLINKLNNLSKIDFIDQDFKIVENEDGLLYHQRQLKNEFKKDALCLQGIETGKTVEFYVRVQE